MATVLLFTTFFMAPVARADSLTTVAYDGFDYSAGTLTGLNGGSGWTGAWTGSTYPLAVNATGLTYTGLTTVGGKSVFASSPTLNATSNRCVPLQDSGIVYFQFLSIFSASHGGGTPNIRFSAGGSATGAVGNNDGRPNMALLNSGLNEVAATTAPLTQLNLTILRIDHSTDSTSIWVNPNLSTFDYLNPPTANGTATSFSPAIECLELITRNSGDFDEIKIMKISGTNSDDTTVPQVLPVGVLNLGDGADRYCSVSSLVADQGSWVTLPTASQCKPPANISNALLLGWSTTQEFPIEIAKRQVDKGWGAYEIFDSIGQISAVFIPAGGSSQLTSSGTLYPIWQN